MKTVETENEGLKRAYTLTISASEIESRVDQEVKRVAPQVRMQGFRPGKVPPNLIRKMHGEALRQDALNSAVQESVQKLLADNQLRPAMQPEVELDEGYEPGKDAEVRVRLETLPEVPKPQIDGLELERLTVEPDPAVIDEQIERLAQGQKKWDDAPEGHAAETGNLVVVDFAGKVDGEAFDGGSGEAMPVEIGSGQLIPGFEDQLIGAKVGEERTLKVQFPDDYPAANLKGKPATFDITVKEVKVAGETKIDDEFAKTLGLNGLEQLRELITGQQQQELNGLTRTHMKRRLLDRLAETHHFPVPQSMVEAEYESIMRQLEHEATHEEDPEAARKELEDEAEEYRGIAERRVRLGLLLSEVGQDNQIQTPAAVLQADALAAEVSLTLAQYQKEKWEMGGVRLGLLLSEVGQDNQIQVSEQEMNRLIGQAAQQYQAKDRERFVQYVRQDPMAAAQLRAPLYEDKVVDFLFSKASITDRTVTRAELEADLEDEVGHVHGPGCGHDHDHHDHAAKPAKAKAAAKSKAKAKSEEPEASAKAKKAKPAKPVKGEVEAEPATPEPAEPVKDGAGAKPATAKAPAKKAASKKKAEPAK